MADLIAVGLTTLDILGAPIDALPDENTTTLISGIDIIPAGTAGGTALVAAVLGMKVQLVSAIGDDRPGRFVRMILDEYGIDTSLVPTLPGLPTSATILPIDSRGRRPTLHAVGASMLTEITEEAISAASNTRFVHWAAIGGLRIDAVMRNRFLQAARQAGATITCDLIAPGPNAAAEVAEILPFVDCFMPSLTEARHLAGHDRPEQAAAAFLAQGARSCVIKCGAAGVLWADARNTVTIPAFDVPVMDTTSCGDAFCAGYLAGLQHGLESAESCRLAASVASLVAQGLGTLGKLTGYEQAEKEASTMKPRIPA